MTENTNPLNEFQEKIAKIEALYLNLKKIGTPETELKILKEKIDSLKERVQEGSLPFIPLSRKMVIQEILNKIQGKTYLEIGISWGECFKEIKVANKIGVDPAPASDIVKELIKQSGVWHYQMTSNEFFERHYDLFDQNPIDVAFVDGLHNYEQSLIDVQNCLKCLSKNGAIIIHDCNPATEGMAIPSVDMGQAESIAKRQQIPWNGAWSGDVWKTIAHLRSEYRDLNVFVLNCDYGLGVVTQGNPTPPLEVSLDEVLNLPFQQFSENRNQILNLKAPNYFQSFLSELQSVTV